MNEHTPSETNPDHETTPPHQNNLMLRRVVGWGISLVVILVLLALLLPPVTRSSREPARRSQCKNHLKQIALALHNYHDVWKSFPPAYTVDGNGKPLHSWRVLLLPYLDGRKLYDSIDLTKPWDDPVNEVARKTPSVIYRCPSNLCPANHTCYVAIVGEDLAFSPEGPRSLSDFTDGTSQTVMVMELPLDQTFEWMEPRDGDETTFLAFNSKTPNSHTGGIQVQLADGSVRFLSANTPPETRRALITISAGDHVGEF